jgi:hypothetical protein
VREYKDINSMTLESLKTFAKAEFSKSIDGDETDVEKVRAQVLAYTRERNATDDFELKTKNEPNILSLQVNDSEYKAYLAGGLELKLVPTNVQLEPVQTDEPVNQAFLGEDATEEATKEVAPVEVKEEAKTDELPTLPELLGKLDKSGLLKLAKENGVKVANTMTAEVLREKLLGALVK